MEEEREREKGQKAKHREKGERTGKERKERGRNRNVITMW
jgi:hypothetical protein